MAKQKVEVQGGGLGDPVDLNERVTMVAPKAKCIKLKNNAPDR
jgi:hypothetical protein